MRILDSRGGGGGEQQCTPDRSPVQHRTRQSPVSGPGRDNLDYCKNVTDSSVKEVNSSNSIWNQRFSSCFVSSVAFYPVSMLHHLSVSAAGSVGEIPPMR